MDEKTGPVIVDACAASHADGTIGSDYCVLSVCMCSRLRGSDVVTFCSRGRSGASGGGHRRPLLLGRQSYSQRLGARGQTLVYRRRCLGSRDSLSPSPMKLNDRTVRKMMSPGKVVIHQDRVMN